MLTSFALECARPARLGSIIAQCILVTAMLYGGVAHGSTGKQIPLLTEEEVQQTVSAAAHGRAVSLRMLQQAWGVCAKTGSCPEEITALAGLRWIMGYIVDRSSGDLILLGSTEPSLAPLRSDNLAVALRNAWLRYASKRGNVITYSAPGCSIDPDPDVFAQLTDLGKVWQRQTGDEASATEARWQLTCNLPQQVRVMGVPFHSAWASIMVRADYLAKSVMDGTDRPLGDDFQNVLDRRMTAALNALHSGRPATITMASMSRIWFSSNEPQLLEDDTTVLIGAPYRVVVETEAERLTQRGMVGSGMEDPVIKEWTVQFTSQYRELRRQRPIYAELEGLFRFVVLSRALKLRDAFTAAALSPAGLLDEAPIDAVDVPRNYNGCYNVRRHNETQTISGRERHVSLVMPSCGGVQMDPPVTEASFTRDEQKRLRPLRARVLAARDDAQKLYWEF